MDELARTAGLRGGPRYRNPGDKPWRGMERDGDRRVRNGHVPEVTKLAAVVQVIAMKETRRGRGGCDHEQREHGQQRWYSNREL